MSDDTVNPGMLGGGGLSAGPLSGGWVDRVKYDDAGLVPVVATDARSGRLLMLAYANREALERTVKAGEAHFFSRSRRTLWHKGETSGNTMKVTAVLLDCDADAVCYQVIPAGPACHTGAQSCFFERAWGAGDAGTPVALPDQREWEGLDLGALGKLAAVIEQRKRDMPEGSYVARLLRGGPAAAARKTGEEATETILAALTEDDTRLVSEVADLWFHSLVLLAARGRSLGDVCEELGKRSKG